MNVRAYVAEFIGTFALIFVGVGAIASAHAGGGLVTVALAHGFTIAVMVSATAAVSGGHLNPAVTIGALVGRKIDVKNGVGYIVSQCLGAIVAALLVKTAVPSQWLADVAMGTPALADGVTISQGLIMEAVLTFFLVFVVFGTGIDPRAPKCGGLFIGLTVALDIMIGGPITGAAMNPARHLGPALVGSCEAVGQIWLYWVGPVIGGIVAALVYTNVLEDKSAGS